MLSRKLLIIAILIILIIIGTISWHNYTSSARLSSSDKEKTIKKVLGRNLRDEKPKVNKWITYRNSYFSIRYPSAADIFTDQKPSAQNSYALTLFSFDMDDPRATFTSGVYLVDYNSPLEEIPAVRLRRSQNNTYRESEIVVSGIRGLFFEKEIEGVEKTIFLLKNNNLYSFSLTGSRAGNDMDDLFDKIISSINIF